MIKLPNEIKIAFENFSNQHDRLDFWWDFSDCGKDFENDDFSEFIPKLKDGIVVKIILPNTKFYLWDGDYYVQGTAYFEFVWDKDYDDYDIPEWAQQDIWIDKDFIQYKDGEKLPYSKELERECHKKIKSEYGEDYYIQRVNNTINGPVWA